MRHTQLTVRNYSSFATVILLISSVSVGFGAVDLLMIAGKGVVHVAAVGMGDLIVVGFAAFFGGFLDAYSSRLAMAEGRGDSQRRLPVLAVALLMTAATCGVAAIALAQGIEPLLRLTGQNPELIPLVGDYVTVRLYSVALLMVYSAVNETLKICGMKNVTFGVLVFGFGANALLDWVFLYSDVQGLFPSPEAAVATASVASQTLMVAASLSIFLWQVRRRGWRFGRPARTEVVPEFWSMVRTGPGIGVRHMNDYMGSIIPMMFIGTLGVQTVAAYGLATKIYTLFCRVPQACVAATFVYYGYEVGRDAPPDQLARKARTLLAYCVVPTAIATVLVVVFSAPLVRAFGSAEIDTGLAQTILFAFMATVPLYIFEATYGEMLTVHQRSGVLSVASTLATWLVMIPLSVVGVLVWKSAALAIALGGVLSTAVLAGIFWHMLRTRHWAADVKATNDMQVA